MVRKKLTLLSFLLLLPFLSVAQHPVVPVATVPFELVQNHVIVQAEINGMTAPFAVDTKTKNVFFYEWAIDSLALDMKPKDKYEGGRDSLVVGKTKPGTIHLANTSFDVGKVWVYENTPYFNYLGQKIAGVFGSTLFDEFVVHFDFEIDSLYLYDPKTFSPDPKMKAIQLRQHRGGVLAKMTIAFPDGRTKDDYVMLSTATDKTVMAKYKIGKRFGYFEKGYARHRARGMELPGHFFLASQSYQTSMSFQGTSFEEVPVTVSHQDKAFAPKHWFDKLMVGTNFLKNYNITFNYSKNKAYLEKNNTFSNQLRNNKSGIILKKSLADNTYIIDYVMPNSPAREAGIQKGDELVSIYKEPAYNYSLDEIEAMLMENSNLVELHVKRKEVIYRKLFRLKDF